MILSSVERNIREIKYREILMVIHFTLQILVRNQILLGEIIVAQNIRESGHPSC